MRQAFHGVSFGVNRKGSARAQSPLTKFFVSNPAELCVRGKRRGGIGLGVSGFGRKRGLGNTTASNGCVLRVDPGRSVVVNLHTHTHTHTHTQRERIKHRTLFTILNDEADLLTTKEACKSLNEL